jgi:hypothetical protein
MLAVVRTAPGVIEVNYLWLPTWIGMNAALIREVEEHLKSHIVMGQPLNEETLQGLHEEVVLYLSAKFNSLAGLGQYINGLDAVEVVSDGQED